MERVWMSPPHLTGEEQKYITKAFAENWIAPIGSNVNDFENNLSSYLGNSKSVVALNSGTSAIHLALLLLGVKKNDVVFCPSFTFTASANPICYLSANPIFIDSEKETWNMCPTLLEKAINIEVEKGIKPKAIIVVHSYGVPAKMDEIIQISEKYNIPIVEDAAAALGSKINGSYCGTLGDFGVFSFNGNKIITTSAGGALVCNSSEKKQKAIHLATQAKDKELYYKHTKIGYNYRLSNVLAGIGLGQLEVLPKRIAKRRENFEFYKNELADFKEVEFVLENENIFFNGYLTCFLVSSVKLKERIIQALENENIESRNLWNPLHLQPVFKNMQSYTNGVSENLFNRGICLPSGSGLTDVELNRIIFIIKKELTKNDF